MKNINKYIISKNGVILPWEKVYTYYPLGNDSSSSSQSDYHDEPMDASALLQRLPRGAYTTCRTVKNGRYIYKLDYHVNRLVVSSASILEGILLKHGDQPTDTESDSSNDQSYAHYMIYEVIFINTLPRLSVNIDHNVGYTKTFF